jgi:hypothetical protein
MPEQIKESPTRSTLGPTAAAAIAVSSAVVFGVLMVISIAFIVVLPVTHESISA